MRAPSEFRETESFLSFVGSPGSRELRRSPEQGEPMGERNTERDGRTGSRRRASLLRLVRFFAPPAAGGARECTRNLGSAGTRCAACTHALLPPISSRASKIDHARPRDSLPSARRFLPYRQSARAHFFTRAGRLFAGIFAGSSLHA